MSASVGLVVIGRNEGERLRRCLDALAPRPEPVVYVDSASSDGSAEQAEARGVEVVRLRAEQGLGAGRARNAGLERLHALHPELRYVQFLDGDCVLVDGWLERARACLDAEPEVAVVCGRRREVDPDRSVYNRLIDLEWDAPVGRVASCGGDAMMRVDAFRAVGGFDEAFSAGEEPELCLRLRRRGHAIVRLDAEMTRHDAALDRFAEWWTRAVRAGRAAALLVARHGRDAGAPAIRRLASLALWAAVLPLVTVAGVAAFGAPGALPLLAYPALALRVHRGERRRGRSPSDARLYAFFCTLGKLPEAWGAAGLLLDRLRGRRQARLIEYKGAGRR